MFAITDPFSALINFFSYRPYIFSIATINLLILTGIGIFLAQKFSTKQNHHFYQIPFYCLLIIISSLAFESFTWIIALGRVLELIPVSLESKAVIIDLDWIVCLIRYQAIYFLIKSLIHKGYTLDKYAKLYMGINIVLASIIAGHTIYQLITGDRLQFLLLLTTRTAAIYALSTIMYTAYKAFTYLTENKNIPILIKKQIHTLLKYFLVPGALLESLQILPIYSLLGDTTLNLVSTPFVMIFYTASLIFCIRRLICFRFLNLKDRLDGMYDNNSYLSGDLQHSVYELSKAQEEVEMVHLAQRKIAQSCNIADQLVNIVIRPSRSVRYEPTKSNNAQRHAHIEEFITTEPYSAWLLNRQLLVTDEIAFNAYYEAPDSENNVLLQFLEKHNYAVFMPLVSQNAIVGYAYIMQQYDHIFFPTELQIRLGIFATFLGNLIGVLNQEHLLARLADHQTIRHELYIRQKELLTFQEAMNTTFGQKMRSEVGLLHYRNGAFTFGNTVALQILGVDPNKYPEHPVAQALHKFAENVDTYRCESSLLVPNMVENQLHFQGYPETTRLNGSLILVRKPEIADLLKLKASISPTPNEHTYLFYLHATQSGRLINKIVPGDSPTMMKFKMQLLKVCLSEKAVLLDAPAHDIKDIVEIIHTISLREQMHTLVLAPNKEKHNLSVEFFGINPILQTEKSNAVPLLEQYNNGTLLIQNVDRLDHTTQDRLADFLKYGVYSPIRSTIQCQSTIRIICTTSNDVHTLLHNHELSARLYEELQPSMMRLPDIHTFSSEETSNLIDYIAANDEVERGALEQAMTLNKEEKTVLLEKPFNSFYELKQEVKGKVAQRKQALKKVTQTREVVVPGFALHLIDTHPELLRAAQLGKEALKDKKLMTLLWKTFGCQSLIAEYLGVNRSSVNRRCKEYGLHHGTGAGGAKKKTKKQLLEEAML